MAVEVEEQFVENDWTAEVRVVADRRRDKNLWTGGQNNATSTSGVRDEEGA